MVNSGSHRLGWPDVVLRMPIQRKCVLNADLDLDYW